VTSLEPDCASCSGLCCVVPPFARGASFSFSKAPLTPCRHLSESDSCRVHDQLLQIGNAGCVAYECFGAGQRVTQQVYAGRTWRSPGVEREEVFAVYVVLRRLHEYLFLLPGGAVRERVAGLADGTPAELLALDLDALHGDVAAALRAHSVAVRGSGTASYAGADLAGQDLTGRDLARADLRGALLIGARLAGSVLDRTDLLGADLRDTDLAGADLSTALFVTQPQLNAARGSAATRLPDGLRPPVTWAP
jgi:hypothetical protein